ncbi:MAG: acyl-CoA dehydrogenase family protein [Spirochaetes bacterium]|nr:acyl-CoA dehydrogenase family protein [Spirochaetota bacterium]
MERSIQFTQEHALFRQTVRKFFEQQVMPFYDMWEHEGIVPREMWNRCGQLGLLLPWLEEQYGGPGGDFLYSVILNEELAYSGANSFMIPLHNDIVAPYIYSFGTEEQKMKYLPKCASGEIVLAIAMTEPEAGSDLAGMKTSAVLNGDSWVLNGQKTFISNGILADLVIVAALSSKELPPHQSVSLFLVEDGTEGFTKGKPIKKIGLKAQDTAELFFDNCRIPNNNLLGQEGQGFIYLMQKLQQERLVCALTSQAAMEKCLAITIDYVKERKLFGKPLSKFQNTQFTIAEMASEIAVGRSFIDDLIHHHIQGDDVVKETCMAKYWICETAKRIADRCLQLFGGYGYCLEYPVSRFYVDARIQTIYAGTSEVMKMIVSRMMGL